MKIGIVKEIKNKEYRVALTPKGAETLVKAGHAVYVQQGAGLGSGFTDDEYRQASAIVATLEQVWDAEMVIKVKEPLEPEYAYLKRQIVFTFFHLAGVDRRLTEVLLERKTTAVAYETLEDEAGRLPLLAPMSAVAGNMAALMGSYYLTRFNGGRGTQLGTVLGRPYGKVVVIGDGVVGQHAAKTAAGMGASVYIAGLEADREALLKQQIAENIHYFISNEQSIARHVKDADLVIGAVLCHGARAPHVVTEEMVKSMPAGSVIVDVSIDQGGCIETSRPTTHSAPVFEKHGVIHYCVTNMPGAYPRTSTIALTHATLPYALRLAEAGVGALRHDAGLMKAVNTYNGCITYKPVAEELGLMARYKPFLELIEAN